MIIDYPEGASGIQEPGPAWSPVFRHRICDVPVTSAKPLFNRFAV